MASRIEPLEITLSEINPDILVLTEHKMNQNEITRLHLNDYPLISHYSRHSTTGGGVAILARRAVRWSLVVVPHILTMAEDKQFEFTSVKFKTDNDSFILVGIYRSPNSKLSIFLDRLSVLLEALLSKCSHIVVAGDFNINVMKNDKHVIQFTDVLVRHGFTYLVDFPTRVTQNTASALDNFLTNIRCFDTEVEGIITSLSDHDAQLLTLKIVTKQTWTSKPLKKYCYNISEDNLAYFKELLKEESWENVYHSSVYNKYDTFFRIFKTHFISSFPRIIKKVNSQPKTWYNDSLKLEKSEIIQQSKLARESKNQSQMLTLKNKYKSYKIKAQQLKKQYYDNKLRKSQNIMKTTWNIINREVGNRAYSGTTDYVINHNGIIFDDPVLICNHFNDYFLNVANTNIQDTNVSFSDTESNQTTKTSTMFRCKPICCVEVTNIIDNLKNNTSCGHDEIPIKVIKNAKQELAPVLTHLINSSFISGHFPNSLKISKTIPIFKKGHRSNMSNYRPISLLPVISKIYEKAMYNRFKNYLDETSLIDNVQHGFRSGFSTITAATQYIESIIDSIDKKEQVIGISMDLSKAFDRVCHSTLLKKLTDMGVNNKEHKWFESYLQNRHQFVEITYKQGEWLTSVKSNKKRCQYGVPQGSILGPLLFLCYLNGVQNTLTLVPKGNMCLYADDTSLKVSSNTQEEIELLSNIELSKIQSYLLSHNLQLNLEKTHFISFSTKQNKRKCIANIIIDGNPIKQLNETNYLGICIDKNLSWDSHVSKICSKINSGLYALKKMSYLCNLETLKSIYFSYIHSHVSYGITLYGATSKNNMDRILKLQKKAIRILLGLPAKQSVKSNFKQLKIMTIYGVYILECIMYVKEHGLNQPTHGYNTRGRVLLTSRHNLDFYKKKTSYIGQKYLQLLPNKIKINETDITFKQVLKEYLLNCAPYSTDEVFNFK